MSETSPPLRFVSLVVCRNPMETEIYPASLRESEIPHRTEWSPGGELTILVAEDWLADAQQTLERAARVFFGQTQAPDPPASAADHDQAGSGPGTNEEPGEGDPDELGDEDASGFLLDDALPSPEETRLRALWPAWALAAVPGLGLGHLWAGKPQMFFYLFFCSLLGFLFYQFTGSLWSFGLVGFAWLVDLGFAAVHVKEANRKALRARKRLEQAEQSFVESQ